MIFNWTYPNLLFMKLRSNIYGVRTRPNDGSARNVGFFRGTGHDRIRMAMGSPSTAWIGEETNLESKSKHLMDKIGKSNSKRRIFLTIPKPKLNEH